MTERTIKLMIVAYVIGVIVCFGPATVQSEQAKDEHMATCEPQPHCRLFGPKASDGLFKALFWPLWLSYTVAR